MADSTCSHPVRHAYSFLKSASVDCFRPSTLPQRSPCHVRHTCWCGHACAPAEAVHGSAARARQHACRRRAERQHACSPAWFWTVARLAREVVILRETYSDQPSNHLSRLGFGTSPLPRLSRCSLLASAHFQNSSAWKLQTKGPGAHVSTMQEWAHACQMTATTGCEQSRCSSRMGCKWPQCISPGLLRR